MNQLHSKSFYKSAPTNLDNRLGSFDLFDQAAPLLPIGAWSCDLVSERLNWTDGVFDMFGLPIDHALEREHTIELYSEESRELLERKRSHAIESRTGFTLDAKIMRCDGIERWIRITAATRCSNGRTEMLYGMKQDITDDHLRWECLRAQAECDPLTGVANRARFQRFLDQPTNGPALDDVGTLMLVDIDDFKQINDRWGHAAGDACLVNLADNLRKAFVNANLVSRIGGDEFAVLLPSAVSRAQTRVELQSLVTSLLKPIQWNDCLLPLKVSVGFAFAGKDGKYNPQTLFTTADESLYCGKKQKMFIPNQASELEGDCFK